MDAEAEELQLRDAAQPEAQHTCIITANFHTLYLEQNLDPGPVDKSVLVEQEFHKSEAIFVGKLLGQEPPQIKGGSINIAWLHDTFKTLPEGANQSDVEFATRAYILYQIGCSLFPDPSGTRVHLRYLALLRDFDASGEMAWGAAVLAHLYRELGKASMKGKANCCAFLTLLQIWAWEHIQIGCPERLENKALPDDQPLGCRWNVSFKNRENVRSMDHEFYRHELDTISDCQITWDPYTPNLIAGLPALCTFGSTHIPDPVEASERVTMQGDATLDDISESDVKNDYASIESVEVQETVGSMDNIKIYKKVTAELQEFTGAPLINGQGTLSSHKEQLQKITGAPENDSIMEEIVETRSEECTGQGTMDQPFNAIGPGDNLNNSMQKLSSMAGDVESPSIFEQEEPDAAIPGREEHHDAVQTQPEDNFVQDRVNVVQLPLFRENSKDPIENGPWQKPVAIPAEDSVITNAREITQRSSNSFTGEPDATIGREESSGDEDLGNPGPKELCKRRKID
nr:unnamed protein product [Digitaria exilis]